MSNKAESKKQQEQRMQPSVIPRPHTNGYYTNKIHYLRTNVLDVLPKRKFALAFLKPVDIKKRPDFYAAIEHAMDLNTIKQRIRNMYYQNVEELIADLKLIVANHKKTTKPEDPKYRNVIRLEKFIAAAIFKLPSDSEPFFKRRNSKSESDSSSESACSDCD